MGGSTKSYPQMPGDIGGLRQQTLQQLMNGGLQPPNMTPNYTQNAMFRPSTMTRGQAMGGQGTGGTATVGDQPQAMFRPPTTANGGLAYTQSPSGNDSATLFNGPMTNTQGGGSNPYFGAGAGAGTFLHPSTANGINVGQTQSQFEPGTYQNLGYRVDPNGRSFDLTTGRQLTGAETDARNNAGAGTSGAGPDQTAAFQKMLNGIFAQNPGGPPATSIADLPGLDTSSSTAYTSDPSQLSLDPRFNDALDQVMANSARFNSPGYDPGVSGATVGGLTGDYQSLNQILDPNAAFFQQIQKAYGDSATAGRTQALAQAKESAGNLTGSGLANTLGTTVNRSLADEQKLIQDALLSAAGVEVGRQGNMAGLENQRNIATAGNQTQASIAAGQLRQQAALTGNQNLLQLANLLENQGQFQAGLDQNNNQFNAGQNQQNSQFNAGQTNQANTNYFNAGVNRNENQATLDQQRNLAQFTGANALSGQNAQTLATFLSQILNNGVGPNQITQSGGAAQLLPALASMAAKKGTA